jgi:TBC domain-containing protein kinase-like protein
LCAPFLVLNYHFEARAFCCLKALVNKYLQNLFTRDNSSEMEKKLQVFQKLLAYHDPELFLHLKNKQFSPELYVIPWFLTLFAHVLPLEKVYKLWDVLLLEDDPHLPLYFSIAFMKQKRLALLESDFNTMKTLTDTRSIDIKQCIIDSESIKKRTPLSVVEVPFLQQQEDQSVPMSLSQYREVVCCRISAQEFVKSFENIAIVLDVRGKDAFEKSHCGTAHHVSPDDLDGILRIVTFRKGLDICIIANTLEPAEKVAKFLIEKHFSYVSVVHGGMKAIEKVKSL